MGQLISYKQNKLMKSLPIIIIFFLTFLILLQSPLNIFSGYGISGTDSSVYRMVATHIENGEMPYKDSFDHKGPLMYILNYLGMIIGGYKGIWLIEFISIFITFFYVYKIAKFRLNHIWSLLIVAITGSLLTIFLEGGNLTEEYAMPFIAISLYIFIDYFKNSKITIFRLIFCGFSFAAVCLLRINMFSPWIAFGLIIFIKTLLKREYSDLRKFIIFFFVGIMILTAPIIIWLIVNDTFIDFINAYFIFNFGYATNGNAARSLANLLERFLHISADFLNDNNQFINKLASACIFCANPLIFISLIYVLIMTFKEKDYFNIAYFIYFIITVALIAMGGRAYMHYGMVLVPLIAYPLTEVIEFSKKNKKSLVILGVIIVTTIGLIFYGGKKSIANCKCMNDTSNVNLKIANLIKEHTDEDDYISVYGNNNIIYLLSERKSASKYSYQFPIAQINKKFMMEYIKELNLNKPKIIVVYSQSPELEMFMDENEYTLLEEYNGAKTYIK